MRVLLLDDNRDWYETCAPPRRCGDQFVTARTYAYGIYMLEHGGRWDTLILDYGLGEAKNGGDVLEWLATHPQCLPGSILVASTNPRGRKILTDAIPKLYAGEPMGDVTGGRPAVEASPSAQAWPTPAFVSLSHDGLVGLTAVPDATGEWVLDFGTPPKED